ncbi:hypothetical protein D3C86_766080 [compost metagenome]
MRLVTTFVRTLVIWLGIMCGLLPQAAVTLLRQLRATKPFKLLSTGEGDTARRASLIGLILRIQVRRVVLAVLLIVMERMTTRHLGFLAQRLERWISIAKKRVSLMSV